jgi:hypothetical protein
MSTKQKPVFNSRYEIVGNSIMRQAIMWFRMKTSILGNFDTGPGLKSLLILLFFHWLGKPIFRLRIWLNNQHALKQKIKSILPNR